MLHFYVMRRESVPLIMSEIYEDQFSQLKLFKVQLI